DLKVHESARDSGVDGPVARTLGAFLWLPPAAPLPAQDRHRFGIAAEGVSDDELSLVPGLLEAADLHQVVVSAWSRDTTLSTIDARQDVLDDALRRILTTGRGAAISLHPVPTALAESRGVESRQPLGVLQGDRSAWLPYVAP